MQHSILKLKKNLINTKLRRQRELQEQLNCENLTTEHGLWNTSIIKINSELQTRVSLRGNNIGKDIALWSSVILQQLR